MTDHSPLVERLRRAKGSDLLPSIVLGHHNAEVTCLQAADAIEALQARVDELEEVLREISEPDDEIDRFGVTRTQGQTYREMARDVLAREPEKGEADES